MKKHKHSKAETGIGAQLGSSRSSHYGTFEVTWGKLS